MVGSNEDDLLSLLKLYQMLLLVAEKFSIPKGYILFIFRNGKWDLPKGKAEANETIDQTALREVEEETVSEDLSISKPLEITYHI